jgi:hypothetical protein
MHVEHNGKILIGLLTSLMMEEISTSETSANVYQTMRDIDPEDSRLQVIIFIISLSI